MARSRKKAEEAGFEPSLARLEAIVRRLEDEQVPLEESLELFAEGRRLARACEKHLSDAENRIRKLVEDADGTPREEEFDAADDSEGEDGEDKDAEETGAARTAGKAKGDAAASSGGGGTRDDLPF